VNAILFDRPASACLGVVAPFGSRKFFGGFVLSVGLVTKMSIDWWLSRESSAPVGVVVFMLVE